MICCTGLSEGPRRAPRAIDRAVRGAARAGVCLNATHVHVLHANMLSVGAAVASDFPVVESVVGVALLAVVLMFLRFLREMQKDAVEESAGQRQAFAQALDKITDRHESSQAQVLHCIGELSEQQHKTTTCLQELVAQMRKTG